MSFASPERVYIPEGAVAHLSTDASRMWTACGLWWPGSGFFGTGSQDEYEEAARRRRCANCTRKVGDDW